MAHLSFFDLQLKEPTADYTAQTVFKNQALLLSDELLVAKANGLVRLALPSWSQRVAEYLANYKASLATTTPTYPLKSICFNQLGLIECYIGRLERATTSCYAHLEWVSQVVAEQELLAVSQQALDAWINLGRLDVINGAYNEALAKFALLQKAKRGEELTVGALTISDKHWQAIVQARPDFYEFIENVFITDSVKALLKSKDYEAVLSFAISNMTGVGPLLHDFLTESQLIALCRLGQSEAALELAQQYSLRGSFLHRLIFQLHRAEALAYFGEEKAALQVVTDLDFIMSYFQLDTKPNLSKLFLTARLVKALKTLGQPLAAQRFAQKAYAGAVLLQDETLQLEFLRFILELNAEIEPSLNIKTQWQQCFHSLVEHTCYRSLRAKAMQLTGPCPPLEETREYIDTLECLDKLFAELTYSAPRFCHVERNEVQSKHLRY
jgi:hypothetical protein